MSDYHIEPAAEESVDARMDVILREFFNKEVPSRLPVENSSSLCPEPQKWVVTKANPARSMTNVHRMGVASIVVAASVLCAAFLGPFLIPSGNGLNQAKAPGEATNAPAHVLDVSGYPDIVNVPPPQEIYTWSETRRVGNGAVALFVADGERIVHSELIPTDEGVFEQRTRVKWTTVRLMEPKSGEWIEATVPKTELEWVRLSR
jgi:hypothetical protein